MAQRARSPRSARAALAAAFAALGLLAPAAARAQSFPTDDKWVPLQRSSADLDDPVGDVAGPARDVVGSVAFPAAYFYGDGSFVYFRLRIDDSVLQSPPANFKTLGWVCLIDFDNDLQSYELSAGVDGNTDTVQLRSNTMPGNTGSPTDIADTLLQSYPAATHAREAAATSTFGSNPDVFIDWAVSQAALEGAGAGAAHPLRLICGSSNNGQSVSTDFITSTGATTLPKLSADPITCNFSGCSYACVGLGQPCTTGVGACEAPGVLLCSGSAEVCDALPGEPSAETCNGIDDDCNGEQDEDFGIGTPCSVGIGACQVMGVLVCDGMSNAMCDALPGKPSAEVCNGIDDDCNGEQDEDFDLGTPCSAGNGACETQGALVCDGMGGTTCSAMPGAPSVETCNGIDDDCNGEIDEGCVTCSEDADCGESDSGRVCDLPSRTCTDGCRAAGGNVCPAGFICSSETGAVGTCSPVPATYFEGNGVLCGLSRAGGSPSAAGALAVSLGALVLRRRRRRAR